MNREARNAAALVEPRVPGERKHVLVLDGIRGLAIALVIWHHTTGYYGKHTFDVWYHFFAYYGSVGVDLFFVLSGYLITGILLDTKARPHFFRNFYARRVLRIFPLYYAVVAISLLVLPAVLPAEKVTRFGAIEGDEIYYWLYVQNFAIARAAKTRHGILDITWSLAIEEQFYLVWPTVVYLCSPRALERVCKALIVGALVSRAFCALVLHLPAFSIYVLTPCRMDALAVGALLAVRAREPGGLAALVPLARRAVVAGPIALVISGVELAMGAVTVYDAGHGPLSVIIGFTLIAVCFAALLVLVVEAPVESRLHRVFASRSLCFCGVYAYGLYLVHLPIRAFVRDRIFGPAYRAPPHVFPRLWNSEFPGQIIFYPLALAAIVPVAWLVYHAYEKQFLKLKRYF